MGFLLGAEALHLEHPTRVVFDAVTLGVNEGDRIGVVGRNGDGKSSLLRMLAGQLEPDAGRVTRRGGVRVGMLSQADDLAAGASVRQAIVGELAEHVWASDPSVLILDEPNDQKPHMDELTPPVCRPIRENGGCARVRRRRRTPCLGRRASAVVC